MSRYNQIGKTATKIYSDAGRVKVRYHATDVVAFDSDTVTLCTGGWNTNTTKTRMNHAANQYGLLYSVSQRAFAWYVTTKAGEFPFDGNTFTFDRATGLPVREPNSTRGGR